MRTIAWLSLLVPAVLGSTSPSPPATPSVTAKGSSSNKNSEYGTFDTPSNSARVKFRYWLPDASVDVHTVQEDIHSAAEIGIGGIEFLPLYNYGGSLAPAPNGSDWARDGFGTQAFCELFKGSLQTAKRDGLVFDFAIGPNQGQGVPASPTDKGLHWDLVSGLSCGCGCVCSAD